LTDKYGRLLRYVYADDVFVNAELVRQGLAEAKAYPPDTKYQGYLEQMETEARLAGRGI
jgi:endonuclease YncB( thermonuclease family)